MRDQFYLVLPSNSSMSYYPENKTTCFTTHLPHQINLHGEWGVALVEIQIPMTFLHVSKTMKSEDHVAVAATRTKLRKNKKEPEIGLLLTGSIIPHGIYDDVKTLIDELNASTAMSGCLELNLCSGGYVRVSGICTDCDRDDPHELRLCKSLRNILGFNETVVVSKANPVVMADQPASLINALPKMLFVYTDVCEPYITGDVQTPLLRVVPLQTDKKYSYASVKVLSFSPLKYIPLLRTTFQTIDIDIRDQMGDPIPFEFGTLSVTLHFKRLD